MAAGGLAALAMVAALLFGRGLLGFWARQMAARRMEVWAIGEAQRWLAWAARFDPGHPETDLMKAACFRHLRQTGRWSRALQSAEREGAPPDAVEQERQLGLLQSGQWLEGADRRLVALIDGGASPHEVAAAFVYGALRRGELEKAAVGLEAWAADHPQQAHVAYMRGVYWRWSGERARAQEEFEKALARQPRHELARASLAGLFEEQDRLDEALRQYVDLATRSPESAAAKVGMARVLRRMVRLDEARAVLEPLTARPEPSSEVVAEMGQIELESSNYQEAATWFDQADLDRPDDQETLPAAATTFALSGNLIRAERFLTRFNAAAGRSTRIYDLRVRLAIDPNAAEAAGELQRLSSSAGGPSTGPGTPAWELPGEGPFQSPPTPTSDLYAQHCGPCHGANGDGNGRAARHLFPRPRDLRTGKFRLVSTRNGVPTLEDLEAGIRQGMPGTAMAPFENLNQDQRMLLAREVQRLNRDGIREHFISALKSEGEEIDEEEICEVVELCTTPGEVVRVPQIGPPDAESIARGKDAYFELGCDNCHGADGTGAWDTPWFDDKGRPSPPRDLVYEPLKGGPEPESIYLRVLLGMPGTPHPACLNAPQERLVGLVHYCRSLSREPKRVLTNHQRAVEASSRVYRTAFVSEPVHQGSPERQVPDFSSRHAP